MSMIIDKSVEILFDAISREMYAFTARYGRPPNALVISDQEWWRVVRYVRENHPLVAEEAKMTTIHFRGMRVYPVLQDEPLLEVGLVGLL